MLVPGQLIIGRQPIMDRYIALAFVPNITSMFRALRACLIEAAHPLLAALEKQFEHMQFPDMVHPIVPITKSDAAAPVFNKACLSQVMTTTIANRFLHTRNLADNAPEHEVIKITITSIVRSIVHALVPDAEKQSQMIESLCNSYLPDETRPLIYTTTNLSGLFSLIPPDKPYETSQKNIANYCPITFISFR